MRKGSRPERHVPGGLSPVNENKRIAMMTILLAIVAGVFFFSRAQEARYRRQEAETVPPAPERPAQVELAVPQIDRARLAAAVRDATDTERVILERDGLAVALDGTAGLLDAHFEAMHGRVLDPGAWREIQADPAAFRGDLFRARGELLELVDEPQPDGSDLFRGALRSEDGVPVHFALRSVPDAIQPGDWMRLDGVFVKIFRDEVAGDWVDAPLLAGPRGVRSWPSYGTVTELGPYDLLDVADANIDSGGNLDDVFEERYRLLAYARDGGAAVDWDAAPVLDNALLTQICKNGSKWRGKPLRIPISKLLGITNLKVGENPARLTQVAAGWIGNFSWTGPSPVVQFQAPFPIEIPEGALVRANAFFFMNAKYVPKKGGLSAAPFLVLQSIEQHIPPEDHFVRNAVLALIALVVAMGCLFAVLLLRDSRKNRELREELIRRRRERRARSSSTPA